MNEEENMEKVKRTPEHKHNYNSFEGLFVGKENAFLTAVCTWRMDDGAWCGKVVVVRGRAVDHITGFLEELHYSFYTGDDDIFLVNAFGKGCGDESTINVVEVIKGIPLVRV